MASCKVKELRQKICDVWLDSGELLYVLFDRRCCRVNRRGTTS
jgi:hypothetical protein